MSDRPADLSLMRDIADDMVLVAAAAEAGIFHALGEGPRTADALATALDFDARATLIVLQALEDAGFLESDGDVFSATERSARELCRPDSPDYRGRSLPHWLHGIAGRVRLGEVLRRGGPLEARPRRRSPERVRRFTSAMAAAPDRRMERIADLCLARVPGARTALDLGGGIGRLSRVLTHRGVVCTMLDVPEVVDHVVDAWELDSVAGMTVVAGDIIEDTLPVGPFELVILGNVLHIYGPEEVADVIRRASARVEPGGILVVVESLRGMSPKASSLAVQMLLKSERGRCYEGREFERWMTEAGLIDAEVEDVDGVKQVVSARRPPSG